MPRKKPRPQNFGEGCQYIYNLRLEDEHRCGQPLTPPAWRYCIEHCESGPKQYKALTNGEYYLRPYRKYKRDEYLIQNSYDHRRSRRGLTEPKLKSFIERAQTAEDIYLCKDAFAEYVVKEINEIRGQVFNVFDPSVDLASGARVAYKRTSALLKEIQRQQKVDPHSVPRHLFVYIKALQRDIARRRSAWAFARVAEQVEEVYELWKQLKGLLGLASALYAKVELSRLQYLSSRKKTQFFRQALKDLDSAKHVCGLAIKHYSGEYKQTALLLGCYLASLEGTLACDAEEPDKAEEGIQALEQRSNDASETIRFSCRIHQAEFYMRIGKIDRATERLDEAKQIFSTMPYRLIEAQLEVAYIKAGLSLATNSQMREEEVHEYISLFQKHPFLTHYTHLQELKTLYEKDVDAALFKGVPVYFDTMFRRLDPDMLPL